MNGENLSSNLTLTKEKSRDIELAKKIIIFHFQVVLLKRLIIEILNVNTLKWKNLKKSKKNSNRYLEKYTVILHVCCIVWRICTGHRTVQPKEFLSVRFQPLVSHPFKSLLTTEFDTPMNVEPISIFTYEIKCILNDWNG